MAEYKFTKDGKKVVVIGTLNNTTKIVQEIFIVEGSEIPMGEHFTESNLFDVLPVSYKMRDLELQTKRIEEGKKENERLQDVNKQLAKKLEEQRKLLLSNIQYTQKLCGLLDNKAINSLAQRFTNDYEWVVDIYDLKILPLKDLDTVTEGGIKLFTLYGNSEGDLTYKINNYKDGSGYDKSYTFHQTVAEAVEELQKRISKMPITGKVVESAEKYGLLLDNEKLNAYKTATMNSIQQTADSYKKSLADLETRLEKLNRL